MNIVQFGAAFHLPTHIDLGHPAWIQHIPLLATVLQVQRPATFVELGVHTGNSYFAGCSTVARRALGTRCVAIDTWQGDEHAGFYGEDVFERVQSINAEFPFSELLRATFEQAVTSFEDGSIDLIHFDGRHYCRDIKQDFETWLPKLSKRSVALLHDVHVYANDFGVAAYWEELKQAHPSFEFFHGHGLGVVLVGDEPGDAVAQWFAALHEVASFARAAFYRLGEAVQDHFEVLHHRATVSRTPELEAARAENVELRGSLERTETEHRRLASDVDLLMSQYHAAVRERDDLGSHLNDVVYERDSLREAAHELRADHDRVASEMSRLRSRRSVRWSLAIAARFRWLFRFVRRLRG
jgi:hypothetical protein